MAKWLDSGWYRLLYGDKYDKKGSDRRNTFLYPDYEALEQGLSELCDWLYKGQWKICGVTPLTRSYTYYDGSTVENHSYGYGYGINPIIGMIVLAQREFEISDEEYAERMAGIQNQILLAELEAKLAPLQEAVQRDQALKLMVEEKKGLLGGVKFVLNDTSYKTREEADQALASLKSACAERAAELESLQREVQQLTVDVEAFESKYNDMK